MSGRSAHVRKEKTKVKEGGNTANDWDAALLDASPLDHGRNSGDADRDRHHLRRPARSISSNSDDTAYARVKKPLVPALDVSGIEKSSFRAIMDRKSEGVRKGLAAFAFGKKKAATTDARPTTAATVRTRDRHEEPAEPARAADSQSTRRRGSSPGRPPYGKLPPVPPALQLRRWAGAGRAPHSWNRLRKDPELWDEQGDTLVFLCRSAPPSSRPPPSLRLSSHVLETTRSRLFLTMLREGYVDFNSDVESPSSAASDGSDRVPWRGRADKHTYAARPDPDGQISYEIFFPAPPNQSKADTLRWHATTRNVFALLYDASLVGLDLYQALRDVQQRLQVYLPETEPADLIINALTKKGIDDVRNDPESAVALLRWSEEKSVKWYEGWREAFVHAVGMYSSVRAMPAALQLSPITRALLERASLESQVRVEAAQERLGRFQFADMWLANAAPAAERGCFDRLRSFLLGFYEAQMGSWPPPAATDDGQWLTRERALRLQADFGALYDYLVNRDICWDCAEERSGRKWTMVSANPLRPVEPDTAALPMTDILIAFDNGHRFPHIPHPYPLVPAAAAPPLHEQPPPSSRASRKAAKAAVAAPDSMRARRLALSYAEATNIYSLGPDFAANRLVDGFVRFEKGDRPDVLDPAVARRGRWVLIYGVLQVLATVAVDTPLLRHKDGVTYHLHPRLRGTPPWRGAAPPYEEATHERSHCWRAPAAWAAPSEADVPMLDSLSVATAVATAVARAAAHPSPPSRSRSSATTETESDTASSALSPSSSTAGRRLRSRWPAPRSAPHDADGFSLGSGYGLGIERIDLWPVAADKGDGDGEGLGVSIRDFDAF